jgi:NTP pyrophosphatase (non-canonical NTP hydrolase)
MTKKQGKNDGIIRFAAEVYEVKTLVDKGIRVTLDLAENETETAKLLMECRIQSCNLQIAIFPIGLMVHEEE